MSEACQIHIRYAIVTSNVMTIVREISRENGTHKIYINWLVKKSKQFILVIAFKSQIYECFTRCRKLERKDNYSSAHLVLSVLF